MKNKDFISLNILVYLPHLNDLRILRTVAIFKVEYFIIDSIS